MTVGSNWTLLSATMEAGHALSLGKSVVLSITSDSDTQNSELTHGCYKYGALTTYQDATIRIVTVGEPGNRCSWPLPQLFPAPETDAFKQLIGGPHGFAHTADMLSLDDGKFVLARLDAPPPVPPADGNAKRDLLRRQLLSLEAHDASRTPQPSLDEFNASQALKPDDATWRFYMAPWDTPIGVPGLGNGTAHIQAIDRYYRGNNNDPNFGMESLRSDSGTSTSYIFQTINRGTAQPGPRNPNVPPPLFSGTLTIPKCAFDFASAPTCYPSVVIQNASVGDATIVAGVSQPGLAARQLGLGDSVEVDRSLGDVTITFPQLTPTQRPFSYGLTVRLHDGPALSAAPCCAESDRLTLYATLGELNAQLELMQHATSDALQALRMKTLSTAIHILSAMAVQRQYPNAVRELLLGRARDVANADQRVTEIRNLVISVGAMTPDDIGLLLTRIDLILADPQLTAPSRASLATIREELVRARDSAAGTSSAVQILRDHLQGEIDRFIAEYQSYVLEYAQYVSNDDLRKLLDADSKSRIAKNVLPADVVIGDSFQRGRGAAIREAAALPRPSSSIQ